MPHREPTTDLPPRTDRAIAKKHYPSASAYAGRPLKSTRIPANSFPISRSSPKLPGSRSRHQLTRCRNSHVQSFGKTRFMIEPRGVSVHANEKAHCTINRAVRSDVANGRVAIQTLRYTSNSPSITSVAARRPCANASSNNAIPLRSVQAKCTLPIASAAVCRAG